MKNQAISNSIEWGTMLLRFTGFPTPDTHIKESNWWKEVVGEPPETRNIQERKRLSQDVGPFEEGNLILKIEPFRIDWHYHAIENPENQDIEQTLGPFNEAVQTFVSAMHKWLSFDNMPSLQRIAFGAIILQPVETREAGYERLSKYLDYIKLDPKGSQDFLFQINRPRNSNTDVPKLMINRLTKWSVRVVKVIGFDLKSLYPGKEKFACRLELDINTSPDPNIQFNNVACQNIFTELVELAIEISEKGDIK